MNILALDTTMDKLAIALSVAGKPYFFIGEKGAKKHNEMLLMEIERLLSSVDASLSDVDAFAVVVGPGSFTGIRVGVATINAFAALGKPIIEITALELTQPEKYKKNKAIVALDCKHENYYAGIFDKDGGVEYVNMTLSEMKAAKLPIFEHKEVNPQRLLSLAEEKASKSLFVKRAKPFYLKKSSAELLKK